MLNTSIYGMPNGHPNSPIYRGWRVVGEVLRAKPCNLTNRSITCCCWLFARALMSKYLQIVFRQPVISRRSSDRRATELGNFSCQFSSILFAISDLNFSFIRDWFLVSKYTTTISSTSGTSWSTYICNLVEVDMKVTFPHLYLAKFSQSKTNFQHDCPRGVV